MLDDQTARQADASPAVVQAAKQLDQDRQTRHLGRAVGDARANRDNALVVARCEYNPRPGCPQTQITGDPGEGPETQTANDILADGQQELDRASAERDAGSCAGCRSWPANALAQSRAGVIASADNGLGARWVAMNHYDVQLCRDGAATDHRGVLRAADRAALDSQVWRGETAQDRRAAAKAEGKAELDADTAVAVKRAEIRAASETLWVERNWKARGWPWPRKTEIERAQQRRRVFEAL